MDSSLGWDLDLTAAWAFVDSTCGNKYASNTCKNSNTLKQHTKAPKSSWAISHVIAELQTRFNEWQWQMAPSGRKLNYLLFLVLVVGSLDNQLSKVQWRSKHNKIYWLGYSCGVNKTDCLCGLVVRVSGYRYRGLGFDSRRYQIFWVVVGLERGPLSLVMSIEELLE